MLEIAVPQMDAICTTRLPHHMLTRYLTGAGGESPCEMQGGPAQLMYFPQGGQASPAQITGAPGGQAGGQAPLQAWGQTFKPGYGYLSVKTLYATNAGGSTVGPSYSNAIIPVPTGQLSMHCGGSGGSGAQAQATPINFSGGSPSEVMPQGCVLAAPSALGQMAPQWQGAGFQHVPFGQAVPLNSAAAAGPPPGGATPTMVPQGYGGSGAAPGGGGAGQVGAQQTAAPGGSGGVYGGGAPGGSGGISGGVAPQQGASPQGIAGAQGTAPAQQGASPQGVAGAQGVAPGSTAPAQAPAGVVPPKFGGYAGASGVAPAGTGSPAGTGVVGATNVANVPHHGGQPLPYHGSATMLLPSLVTGRLSSMLVGALLLSVALL